MSGFDGVVRLRVNKRDLDVGLALYEMLPDGKLFQLTYYTERASYAADMSVRHLLTPGRDATVPFEQDYLFRRWVAKGNRLLLTVNVNKNAFAEVNYGTGKDVGQESVKDAGSPSRCNGSRAVTSACAYMIRTTMAPHQSSRSGRLPTRAGAPRLSRRPPAR